METPQPVTGEEFRDVIGRFATGVTVITAHDGEDHGMTASAVSSLSLDPPMLLVCINRQSRTGDAVHASGRFTVNVLAEDQSNLAYHFAAADDRFTGVEAMRGPLGTLHLDGAIAHIDCSVADDVSAATHRIVLGLVERVSARDGAPLAYYRGQFGQFHPARDDAITLLLRERILNSADTVVVDPDQLTDELDTDRGRVDRALAALRAEGLVAGDPVTGYRASPIDLRAINDALDARCAIEMGAMQMATPTPDQLADLRRLADKTVELTAGGQADDVEAYAQGNNAFHEALVRLSSSQALLDAYRRLSLSGILIRGVPDPRLLESAHANDHVAIVDALAAGDMPAASAAIRQHTDRSRDAHERAVRQSG